jgi:hypothetical protein
MAITITGDTGGPLVSSTFIFTGGSTGLTFNGSGLTETLQFAGITANGGTVSLATDATASTINIGTGAGIKAVTLGSTFAGSTTTLQAPSGGMKMLGVSGVAVANKNYVTIDTITGELGSDAGSVSSITITGDTGGAQMASSFVFAGGTTGLSFNGVADTFTLAFAGITANGGTVSLATDAGATTLNIGTGAGAKTLTLGSTNSTSTTNLQAGSGGIKIPAFAEGALVTSSAGKISTVTGTAGFVLTANAPGTAPSFQAVPGAGTGNPVLIQSQTASGSATIDFTSGVTGYTYYILECLNVLPATNNVDFQMQYSTDAGVTWTGGTSYIYFGQSNVSSSSAFNGYVSAGTSQFLISPGNSNSANFAFYGIAQLFGFTNLSKQVTWSFTSTNSALATQQAIGAGRFTVTGSNVNAIRLKMSSGNISIGTFRLFGVM